MIHDADPIDEARILRTQLLTGDLAGDALRAASARFRALRHALLGAWRCADDLSPGNMCACGYIASWTAEHCPVCGGRFDDGDYVPDVFTCPICGERVLRGTRCAHDCITLDELLSVRGAQAQRDAHGREIDAQIASAQRQIADLALAYAARPNEQTLARIMEVTDTLREMQAKRAALVMLPLAVSPRHRLYRHDLATACYPAESGRIALH